MVTIHSSSVTGNNSYCLKNHTVISHKPIIVYGVILKPLNIHKQCIKDHPTYIIIEYGIYGTSLLNMGYMGHHY